VRVAGVQRECRERAAREFYAAPRVVRYYKGAREHHCLKALKIRVGHVQGTRKTNFPGRVGVDNPPP
jgi:hypothetical protein